MDFDFLANETLSINNQIRKNGNFHFNESEDFEAYEEKGPTGPGVIYRIDKSIGTFCIRGSASEDLEWSLDEIKSSGSKESQEWEKTLRLDSNELSQMDDIFYFETQTFPQAEILADQLLNRRFPLEEDLVCNISDPGFSWWMKSKEGSFEIYFQSYGIERANDLVQLGPLGDKLMTSHRFNRAISSLRKLFSINEFSCTEKSLTISAAHPKDENFRAFQSIFTQGQWLLPKGIFENVPDGKTLFLFFQELAILRRFWVNIESQLEKKLISRF